MANGDVIDQVMQPTQLDFCQSWKLIEGSAATDDGAWVDVRGFRHFSLDVSGITTATVQLRGSNATTKPANNTHGRQIGADITADGLVSAEIPVRWMKARVSAYTSGTVVAHLNAVPK